MKTIASQLHKHEYSWVAKPKKHIRGSSQVTILPFASILTACDPGGLGHHNSLEEYCGPHIASSMFFIVLSWLVMITIYLKIIRLTNWISRWQYVTVPQGCFFNLYKQTFFFQAHSQATSPLHSYDYYLNRFIIF